MAVRRIAEQADRAGQVIRSVHDFVRRRDRTREPVAPQTLLDAAQKDALRQQGVGNLLQTRRGNCHDLCGL